MATAVIAEELPVTTPQRAREVALAQRLALIRQLEGLGADQWVAPTECRPWTVRDVVAHIAGELVYTRNPFAYVGLAAVWLRRYRGRSFLDGTNEAAVQARRGWTTSRLLEVLRRDAPRAVPPGWARPLPLAGIAGLPRYATFGYLTDVVLPRDCFMHRHDIARAAGEAVGPDPADAEVVAQVVRDLAIAWDGPDFVLHLTGPAGGTWRLRRTSTSGSADLTADLDATEFLRQLSGRATEPDLFEHVPDELREPLTDARVTF